MALLKNSIFIFLLLLVALGCKESAKDIDVNHTMSSNRPINDANAKWKTYTNSKSDSLSSLYAEQAIKILDDGNTIVGSEAITNYYQSENHRITGIYTDTVLMANEDRGLEYEIGEYIDSDISKHKQIIIWETKDNSKKRVFEFSAKVENAKIDRKAIDSRRNLWMKLCNMHDSEALVNEMYSKNTLYFNHKPLVAGRALLAKEYDYMNAKNYELSLDPIVVNQVNKNFVFEIGQCEGSYNGKYIIIWRKEKGGKWEVFIDSNI